MSWRDRAKKVPDAASTPAEGKSSWRDRAKPVKPEAEGTSASSKLNSTARGFAQGGSMGFADETVGAVKGIADDLISYFSGNAPKVVVERDEFGRVTNSDELNKAATYEKHRDAYRAADAIAKKENPELYTTGQVGGAVATSFLPGVGALNAATKTKLAGTAAQKAMQLAMASGESGALGAIQNGLNGLGDSEAESAGGLVRDTAIGAGTGFAFGAGVPVLGQVGKYGLSKVAPLGDEMKRVAENLAEKATGATGAQAAKFEEGAGRELLDRGLVRFGDSAENIAVRTQGAVDKANKVIDDSLRILDEQGVTASADNVVAVLQDKIDELKLDSAQADVVRALEQKVMDIVGTGRSKVPVSAAEVTKRGHGKRIRNWANPHEGEASKSTYLAYRDEVERVAKEADPYIADKFIEAKKTHGLLSPIQEAAEKRALQQNQSPLMGLKDIVAAGTGGAPGYIANALLSPRIASSAAVATDKLGNVVSGAPELLARLADPLLKSSARGASSLGTTSLVPQLAESDDELHQKIAEGERVNQWKSLLDASRSRTPMGNPDVERRKKLLQEYQSRKNSGSPSTRPIPQQEAQKQFIEGN